MNVELTTTSYADKPWITFCEMTYVNIKAIANILDY